MADVEMKEKEEEKVEEKKEEKKEVVEKEENRVKFSREVDVGITEYLTESKGFTGRLKER